MKKMITIAARVTHIAPNADTANTYDVALFGYQDLDGSSHTVQISRVSEGSAAALGSVFAQQRAVRLTVEIDDGTPEG